MFVIKIEYFPIALFDAHTKIPQESPDSSFSTYNVPTNNYRLLGTQWGNVGIWLIKKGQLHLHMGKTLQSNPLPVGGRLLGIHI